MTAGPRAFVRYEGGQKGRLMTAKKKQTIWCGYLDAGERGSPVVRDGSLDTGNPSTIYLFNMMKGRILEYRREIAEPKLREFTAEEQTLLSALEEAFQKERAVFKPRETARAKPAKRPAKEVREQLEDLDDEIPWTLDDIPETEFFEADTVE